MDYAKSGSILFRTADGLKPVGVMYGAPGNAGPADLEGRAPLSVATWHRHVGFCLPTDKDFNAQMEGPRFGYEGSIHDEAACRRASGYWLPLAFGWMTHMYPDERDQWGGEHMDPAAAGTHEH